MTHIFVISVRKTEMGQSLLFHNAWETTSVAPLLCSRLTLFVIGWRLYQIFFRYCEEREGKLHQSSKFLFHAAASWRQWNHVPADITYVSLPAEATPYIFQTVLPRVRMELFEVTKYWRDWSCTDPRDASWHTERKVVVTSVMKVNLCCSAPPPLSLTHRPLYSPATPISPDSIIRVRLSHNWHVVPLVV